MFNQQRQFVNGGSSTVPQAPWFMFENLLLPGQAVNGMWPNTMPQVPPMLPSPAPALAPAPAEATQHLQTLPQYLTRFEPAPVGFPNHPVHTPVENHDSSSVPPKRGKGKAWSEEEHKLFLRGLRKYGKGEWKSISSYIRTKTPTQVASHAQKYFIRQTASQERKKRKSIHDMILQNTDVVPHCVDPQNLTPPPGLTVPHSHDIQQTQEMPPLHAPNSTTNPITGLEYVRMTFK